MAENSDFKNKHIKSIISNLDDIHKEIKDSIIRNDSESINFLTQLSEQYIASLFMIGRINNSSFAPPKNSKTLSFRFFLSAYK